MHGGAKGAGDSGEASPSFKHGRYSLLRPKHLRSKFDAAMADPDLLSVRDLSALWHTRCAELVEQLEASGSGQLLVDLRGVLAKARKDIHKKHLDLQLELRVLKISPSADQMTKIEKIVTDLASSPVEELDVLEKMITDGAAYKEQWEELAKAGDKKAQYSKLERQRMIDLQQMVTREQALILLQEIIDSVRRHVRDKPTLGLIYADYMATTGINDRPEPIEHEDGDL
jgi:hypothetical protein